MSTQDWMRANDPVGYQDCVDAGRFGESPTTAVELIASDVARAQHELDKAFGRVAHLATPEECRAAAEHLDRLHVSAQVLNEDIGRRRIGLTLDDDSHCPSCGARARFGPCSACDGPVVSPAYSVAETSRLIREYPT